MKKSDAGLLEAGAALALRTSITGWAPAAALALGVTLPALPVLKQNYLLFLTVLLILAWVKLRGETWASFGLIVPAKWGRIVGYGLLLFAAQLAFSVLALQPIEHAVAAFTGSGPNKAAQVLGELTGNFPLFVFLLPFVWLFAAFGEEVFYRGYLMSRFAQFMGEGKIAWTVAVVAQAILFGAAHAYQGPPGMVGVAIGALISGAGTLIWGRNLWPAIIAHGLIDTLGFTLIYMGKLGSHG
ncbi:MAG: CPBP family intramembrane metalloprotease [Alphaproteobacteria bacterium]|nr:CPBP family intramembrane metalloprotease [Alphaproteobacteria bacterium]